MEMLSGKTVNEKIKTKVLCYINPKQPLIRTARLVMRPFTLADAPDIHHLANDKAVSSMMLKMPYPYHKDEIIKWIINQKNNLKLGLAVNLAIINRGNNRLMGAIGLTIDKDFERAELSYWLGKPYWGCGFCTEAAEAILRYGFENLNLNRIYGHYFRTNRASGRVMQKLGMSYEGCLRQHVKKWELFHDVETYGILKEDYEQLKEPC